MVGLKVIKVIIRSTVVKTYLLSSDDRSVGDGWEVDRSAFGTKVSVGPSQIDVEGTV